MADDYEQEPDRVEEEFAVWKKNTPFLYDLVLSHPLQWPSLTVHWVPSSPQPHPHPSFNLHKLVLGTHTSEGVSNFLMIADAALPVSTSDSILNANAENPLIPKIEVTQRILVDGEVNRARCMPQNPSVIGAKTSSSEVYVFDCAKQLEKNQELGCDPDLRLRGHDKEGYGLCWSPFTEGRLLSGSHDHKICSWDVSAASQEKVLDAVHTYEAHESVVEDVSWHMKNENLFGSVGDDCKLIIWDFRTNQAQQSVKAHEREGVVFSNIVTTVSPTYAQEVQTEEGGLGLHSTLTCHSNKFIGILNGIDTDAWNPATDTNLKIQYNANDVQGKIDAVYLAIAN